MSVSKAMRLEKELLSDFLNINLEKNENGLKISCYNS